MEVESGAMRLEERRGVKEKRYVSKAEIRIDRESD